MVHLLLKRRPLFVVVTSILIALMIPSLAFAAPRSTSVGINSRCGIEGAQTIVTLNKGQEIDITAVATGNDGTHEDEALSIFADLYHFDKIVQANTGSHQFEYEANHNNVSINACWSLVRNDDDLDYASMNFFTLHVATVTYKFS